MIHLLCDTGPVVYCCPSLVSALTTSAESRAGWLWRPISQVSRGTSQGHGFLLHALLRIGVRTRKEMCLGASALGISEALGCLLARPFLQGAGGWSVLWVCVGTPCLLRRVQR